MSIKKETKLLSDEKMKSPNNERANYANKIALIPHAQLNLSGVQIIT